MKLKNKIDLYLELYHQNLIDLLGRANDLQNKIDSKPKNYWDKNKEELKLIHKELDQINSDLSSLEDCKNDCIKNA